MSILAAGTPATEKVRASVGVFVSLAGVACGITLLFLGMRAVMDIGGVCAEGGPYVIRQSCPDGVPALLLGGIWGGIVFCALYVWQTIKHGVPSLLLLAWPALFLSLGWNFLEYGVNPPDDSGLVWAWLICGIVFFIMGGVPLIVAFGSIVRSFDGDEPAPGFRTAVTDPLRTLRNMGVSVKSGARSAAADPTSSSRATAEGLVDELERLAALHRSGALGDAEYAAAKRRLLENNR